MKSNESQNTKIAEQILVKRSSATYGLVFKVPLHTSCAAFLGDASTLSGIHFFIDQFLTDCQSKEARGDDRAEHG